jgi:N-acyl-D-aspartate/D-glutamate deacylase
MVDSYDLIIRNGTLIDGTGGPSRQADIGIAGERIVAVGKIDGRGIEEIDASGLVVSPGFVDVHTHDDGAVLANPRMTAKISQGVTTVIVGNCGISLSPIAPLDPPDPLTLLGGRDAYRFPTTADYVAAVRETKPSVNVGVLIGHTTLRLAVMDDLKRNATPDEAGRMRTLLEESLDAGAIGFSTGLYYKLANAAQKDEVVAIAGALHDKGGIYTTHMRNEHEGVMDSLRETFATAGEADVPVVVSHHKCAGPDNWHRTSETLPFIAAARETQAIGLDAYPYTAGSTVLEPDWIDERIRTMITTSVPHPEMTGRDLSDIAAEWGVPQKEAARRLVPAGAVYFQMIEEDVRKILAFPATMIGSDGLPRDTHPHPRLWGTFPRVLGHYARDVGLFPLEIAVHKMTGLSAKTFNLKDRGVVREGAYADLVLFDPATIADVATFENPTQKALGISKVLVNGAITYANGAVSDHGAGMVVERN